MYTYSMDGPIGIAFFDKYYRASSYQQTTFYPQFF